MSKEISSFPIFKLDIQQALTASIVLALQVHFAGGGHNTEYLRGCLAHAQAIALAVGLDWKLILNDCLEQLGVDLDKLLFSEIQILEGGSDGSRH